MFKTMQLDMHYTLPQIMKMSFDEFQIFIATLTDEKGRHDTSSKTTIDKAFPGLFI